MKKRSLLLALLIFATSISTVRASDLPKLSQEELVNISRPAIVRIVHHIKGTITIKPFKLNLNDLTISEDSGAVKTIPVDEYITGSGFVVSKDGYIITNSHVISSKETKLKAIASVVTDKISETPSATNPGSGPDAEAKMKDYAAKINDYLLKEGKFDLEENVVVLDPSSQKENVLDLIADGFPITVISLNDNFVNDKWDVALIKIDQTNLPALPLGEAYSIQRGEKLGDFGFPTTAELNNRNLLESTFTQGAISAIKDSENGDFKIIQTDAKISDGSSGGPLLDENGRVIGMITYQTDKTKMDTGDNFAFAIPIDTVLEGIKKFNVSNSEFKPDLGEYNPQFSAGLALLNESQCKAALLDFTKAENVNEKFNVASNVSPYVKKCQELISSNQSIDTPLDKLVHTLFSLSYLAWIGIILLILIFASIAVVLIKQKRSVEEKESEIEILEEENKEEEKEIIDLKEEVKEIKKIEEDLIKVKNKKD